MAKQDPQLKAQLNQIKKTYQATVAAIRTWHSQSSKGADKATKAAINQQYHLLMQDAKAQYSVQLVQAQEQFMPVPSLSGSSQLSNAATFQFPGMFAPGVVGGPSPMLPFTGPTPVITTYPVPASISATGYPASVTAPVYYQTQPEIYPSSPNPQAQPAYYPPSDYDVPNPAYSRPPNNPMAYAPASPYPGDSVAYPPSSATMLADSDGGPQQVAPEVLDALMQQDRSTYVADPWSDVWGNAFGAAIPLRRRKRFQQVKPFGVVPIYRRAPRRTRKHLSIIQSLNAMPVLVEDFGQTTWLSTAITAAGSVGSAAVTAALTPRIQGQKPAPPINFNQPAPVAPKSAFGGITQNEVLIGGGVVLGLVVLMIVMKKK